MAPGAPAADAVEALNRLAKNAASLVAQLELVASAVSKNDGAEASNSNAAAPEASSGQDATDALSLAHDAAILIKAHSTKISLFIINEPFTPTAISKVLQELIAGPIPALASAIQICHASRYTTSVRQGLSWRCLSVLREFKALLVQIPQDGKVLWGQPKIGKTGNDGEQRSIATTGVLWAACDEIIRFSKQGVASHLISKIENCQSTLKDVLEELKEWSEETSDDEDDDEDNTHDEVAPSADQAAITSASNTHESTQALLDSIMNSVHHIPPDDPDRIRERLDSCLRRLRLTTLLYQAIIKRRLKKLPRFPTEAGSNVAARLDEIMPLLLRIPELFTSLALAFYELDAEQIDRLMDRCFFESFAVSELLLRPWEGAKDEFSDWVVKFQVEIKRV